MPTLDTYSVAKDPAQQRAFTYGSFVRQFDALRARQIRELLKSA